MLKLKSDKYRKARGGHSRFLLLSCEKCGHRIAVYQKDGPGPLKRIYLDRISMPTFAKKDDHLVCLGCKSVLGEYFIYAKEKRPTVRLFVGAIKKKAGKGNL